MMVTVATSTSVVSPVPRQGEDSRSSSPAPMLSCCASMVTGVVVSLGTLR